MRKFCISCFLICCLAVCCFPQSASTWDNTQDKQWRSEFREVSIPSSMDGQIQKARVFFSSSLRPQPLIVSLHTWSGNYNQEDPLANEAMLRNWNYIHPDFRGPNNRPVACGSPQVISDLKDAIHFMIREGKVDSTNIHIIGVSGGGYLALMAYQKLDFPVKSFHAWVPVSDLTSWYWESKGRNSRYAADIEKIAAKDGHMNWKELRRRSPLQLSVPAKKRKFSSLHLYAGVHDGYSGSVPISHSILYYNKVVAAFRPLDKSALVKEEEWHKLLITQVNSNADTTCRIGGRVIHLKREFPELSLTIFEGGHEMLSAQALSLIKIDDRKGSFAGNIVTIGDSNGAFDYGWPAQLSKLLPYAKVCNQSIAGNTIGFDNLGRKDLNSLRNIDQYLSRCSEELGGKINCLVIGLGTNDAKKIFDNCQQEVPAKLDSLLSAIDSWFAKRNIARPPVLLICPPPVDEKKADAVKYGGANERVRLFGQVFSPVASKHSAKIIDAYQLLKEDINRYTEDGIHLSEQAQFRLASEIITFIR